MMPSFYPIPDRSVSYVGGVKVMSVDSFAGDDSVAARSLPIPHQIHLNKKTVRVRDYVDGKVAMLAVPRLSTLSGIR